ncbi:MAG: sporulation initiation factor Spo0A C-terminal domain-containing protein [Lachnospiraceae bacterium]|nr:MAG: phosphoglycolate phosphatase [Lachnospiraceae bacterium]
MKLSGEKMEGQERVEVLGATTTKLLRLGFQAQQIGYRYLREAVWVVCSDPEMITSVTKLLYPEIAKRFSTTDKQVERAIRNSIETAWVKGNRDAWKALAGQSIQENATRPTNREMISLLAGSVSKER